MCVELFINACKPLYQGPGFLSAALLYVSNVTLQQLLTAAAAAAHSCCNVQSHRTNRIRDKLHNQRASRLTRTYTCLKSELDTMIDHRVMKPKL